MLIYFSLFLNKHVLLKNCYRERIGYSGPYLIGRLQIHVHAHKKHTAYTNSAFISEKNLKITSCLFDKNIFHKF